MKVSAKLIITVSYDADNAVAVDEIQPLLRALADRAASEGLLSGDNPDLTVSEWDCKVEIK